MNSSLSKFFWWALKSPFIRNQVYLRYLGIKITGIREHADNTGRWHTLRCIGSVRNFPSRDIYCFVAHSSGAHFWPQTKVCLNSDYTWSATFRCDDHNQSIVLAFLSDEAQNSFSAYHQKSKRAMEEDRWATIPGQIIARQVVRDLLPNQSLQRTAGEPGGR